MRLRQPLLLLPFGVALTFSHLAQAQEALQLAPLQVTSSELSEGEAAQAQLRQVPGGTNYIDMASVEQGRVSSKGCRRRMGRILEKFKRWKNMGYGRSRLFLSPK